MLKNYLKIAIRHLLRYKAYTAINILGLATGMSCCMLIMLFIRNEFSFDRFNKKADRIYRLWQFEKYEDQQFINTVTPLSAAAVIQKSYPEVESTCRAFVFNPMVMVNKTSFPEAAMVTDSTLFQVFDFTLLQGDRKNPFPNPNTVILTEETAKKFFGNVDAMGKQLEITLGNARFLFTVSGIAERAPRASSQSFNMLLPFSIDKNIFGKGALRSWFNVQTETYLLLKKDVSAASLEKKFPAMVKSYLGDDYKEGAFVFHLQPLTDIHLNPDLPPGNQPISNPKYSYILGTLSILILLVACINFITLSIGRSTTRALEVGVRKVLGAERRQLIRQFWSEAFLLTLLSVVTGLILTALLLKPFNQLANRDLVFQFDGAFILFSVVLIALIGLVAGIYPAIILSGFNPIEVLKGKVRMKGRSGWLRQGLIVGQFGASIAMIVCAIMIGRQMDYLMSKDLGYSKDQVIVVPTNKSIKQGQPLANLYRNELLRRPEVADVSVSVFSFVQSPWATIGFTDDKHAYHGFQYNSVDANFIRTMRLTMAKGRPFSPDNAADINNAAIVNEAFLKEFGLTDPIGKKLPGPFDQQIIGVVKDFNFESLRSKVQPLLLTISPDSVLRRTENISFLSNPNPRISIRMKPGYSASANVELLKNAWKTVVPDQDFAYSFLDETIAAQYKEEQRTSSIVRWAAGLSIFIACMGLFGLATLSVLRRTREIGIRKVLGAEVRTIVGILSIDFLKPVLIAAVIAIPPGWWFINDWLKDFAYRTAISWWIFGIAAVVAIIIALLTVSVQTIRAALTNPVKSLRTE